MAEGKDIIIQVDAEKAIKRIEELAAETDKLRESNKSLAKAYADGDISLGEYTKALIENKTAIRDNEKQEKALAAQVNIAIKQGKQYGDTLNDERNKLRDMQQAYAAMDAAMREGKGGKEFLAQIKAQSDKVKGMEQAMGDARRNVGNYEEALKNAGVGVSGLTQKMKAFLANPWALLLAAIVAAFKGIVDAFKGSEDRMRELQKATAPLRAALDLLRQLADKLAKKLSEGLVVVMGKLTEGMGWLAKQLDKLGKKVFNKDWGLSEKFEQATEAVEKLTDAQNKYQDHQRAFVVKEAKINKELAELRDKVAQKDNYTNEERLAFLDEIAKKEEQLAKERTQLAKENLAILQQDAARSENDAEANDELARAKAEVINQEAAYYAKMKEVSAQTAAIKKQIAAEGKAEVAEEKKAIEDNSKLDKARLDAALAAGIERIGKENELTQEMYDLHVQYYDSLLALYNEDTVEYQNALAAKAKYNADYNAKVQKAAEDTAKKEAAERKKATDASIQGFSSAMQSASQAFGTIAEQAEEGSAAQKAAAMAGLVTSEAATLANEGKAIAAAVAGATEAAAATGPAAPFTLAAFIASMVASVVSGIVSAISTIKQAKSILQGADGGNFAQGGFVPGTSYSGDKVNVHANSAEAILTPAQQRNFMELANGVGGGFDYGAFADVVVAAVAAQPAPVMDYAEFTDFQQRTATYNEIARV